MLRNAQYPRIRRFVISLDAPFLHDAYFRVLLCLYNERAFELLLAALASVSLRLY